MYNVKFFVRSLYLIKHTGCLENNDKSFTEWTKLRRKVLYHFAILAIINMILIAKNCRKLIFNNFLLKYCELYRKTVRDKNCLSSHKGLRIFSEFFNTVFSLMLVKIRKCSSKKF